VAFTFEWSEDVMSNEDGPSNFSPDDIELTDDQGNYLAFSEVRQVTKMEARPNGAYYGEAVARVPATTAEESYRFVGLVEVPEGATGVEAMVTHTYTHTDTHTYTHTHTYTYTDA
jgi:hypothetical protein